MASIAMTVLICLSLAMCNSKPGVLDIPIIAHAGEYQQVLQKAESLSKEPFEKRNRGEYLTEEDKELLTQATPQFRALIAFDPGQFAPNLALGKIFLELDDPTKADEYLLYCLGNLKEATKSNDPVFKAVEAECRYELSNARFKVGNYEAAVTEVDLALAITEKNPNYYYARAAAYSELRRSEEAMADVLKAIRLNPNHKKANSLLKLLLIAEENKKSKGQK